MEIHSHTHTARKKWHHFFWEFFMLFLAVTLGFFVENQREHFVEHQRARQFAANLLFDISRDTSYISYLMNYERWKENKIDDLINQLQSGESSYNARKFYTSLRSLDSWKISDSYSNTYDDLKSSGLLRYYTANHLADRLKEYYSTYRVLDAQERETEKFHIETCEPFLDNHFNGLSYLSKINGEPQSDTLVFPPDPKESISLPDNVRKTLLNIVVRLKYKKGLFKNVDNYAHQYKTANDLIRLLKEDYHL